MMSTPQISSPPPPVSQRWLWVVRAAAGISTIPSWVAWATFASHPRVCAEKSGRELGVLIPVMLPYLHVLWRLRGKTLKKGLALAVVTGFLWVGLAWLPLVVVAREVKNAFALILGFALLQVIMAAGAIKTYYTLPREDGDHQILGRGFVVFIAYVLICLIIMAWTIPDLTRSRFARTQASAVGVLRTVNVAEITFSQTYQTGFAPGLSALGPGPANSSPSRSAAGLIDSETVSGIRDGYKFTYSAGPPDGAGSIKAYTLIARPVEYGVTGCWSLRTDESGVIHKTNDNRPATRQDPPITG
ncbi:MAG: hypothetical protein LAN62_12440 [Acidobacteriia bacterium]|nr:hypothetical protein [Terriglobia bacterium]